MGVVWASGKTPASTASVSMMPEVFTVRISKLRNIIVSLWPARRIDKWMARNDRTAEALKEIKKPVKRPRRRAF